MRKKKEDYVIEDGDSLHSEEEGRESSGSHKRSSTMIPTSGVP